ncbi:unnamed protein product, partial [Sphacelaria rigidula]
YAGVKDVVDVACGNNHCLALTRQGQVFSFGINDDGQLGKSCPLDADEDPSEDYRVPALVNVCPTKAIACGAHHSMVVTLQGKVLSTGCNGFGQLGLRTNDVQMFSFTSAQVCTTGK